MRAIQRHVRFTSDSRPSHIRFTSSGPDEVTDEFLALYDEGIWPARRTLDAMVSAVDSTVANVSAALERAGMAQDTLTILVSDK